MTMATMHGEKDARAEPLAGLGSTAFDNLVEIPLEFIDAGGGQVVAVVRFGAGASQAKRALKPDVDLRHPLHAPSDAKIAVGREYWTPRGKPSKPPGCRSSCAVTPRPRSPAERVPPVYLWMGGSRGAAAAAGRDTARAMSQENVGVVKAAADAFARDGVDGWLEGFPDESTTRRLKVQSMTWPDSWQGRTARLLGGLGRDVR